MSVLATNGSSVTVTQDGDGFWFGNGAMLRVCRSCFTAQAPAFSHGLPNTSALHIKNFTTVPHARELKESQLQPSYCACGYNALRAVFNH
jgi:hypothetical protein